MKNCILSRPTVFELADLVLISSFTRFSERVDWLIILEIISLGLELSRKIDRFALTRKAGARIQYFHYVKNGI